MNTSKLGRGTVVLLALAAGGVVALLVILLSSGTDSTEATGGETNPAVSVVGAVDTEARQALPAEAQEWLEVQGESPMPGLKGEELIGFGRTDSAAGEVVVAQYGQSLCIFVVATGASTCGGMNLISEGKLLVFTPGCERTTVVGLLPDGVTSVEVAPAAADAKAAPAASEVPVRSNVYAVELEPVDAVLSGAIADGRQFKTELPLGQVGCRR